MDLANSSAPPNSVASFGSWSAEMQQSTASPTITQSYLFPKHRLKRVMQDPVKEPLVIVACGSFSPVTYLHLRMFEMAHDYILDSDRFEALGGYFSPVSDGYAKPGLAHWQHRVSMCELAASDSSWLMVDPWEPSQPKYIRTALVLDHFEQELNSGADGGVLMSDGMSLLLIFNGPIILICYLTIPYVGSRRRIRIMLLAGGDLIQSFAVPNLWKETDLSHILGDFGCLIIERTGANVYDFLLTNDALHAHRKNVFVVKQYIHNDISSTKIRLFVCRGMSIKYLVPDLVIAYIQAQSLYNEASTRKT
ncbi:Nicotinamide/nicotinic acid mononucleotide adenylyltransferase 1 [Batrachochytrium dendrobatidis]